jgi:hypothetical protein
MVKKLKVGVGGEVMLQPIVANVSYPEVGQYVSVGHSHCEGVNPHDFTIVKSPIVTKLERQSIYMTKERRNP